MSKPDYIHLTQNPAQTLQKIIASIEPDRYAVLVDENTETHCLPLLNLPDSTLIIRIKSGEAHKTLATCQHIWEELTNWSFSRKSLLINLGGGVIGDMGGFCAATFKRGIRFVNLPTTLLAAVDANIGGKLGIDFMGFKNHIGLFSDPAAVIVFDGFLNTLPLRELKSGFAEVLKHGLIQDKKYWELAISKPLEEQKWKEIIKKSIEIKGRVVKQDPYEKNIRKHLNFGHTLGHAIESWYLKNHLSLLHGEAIAIGMIMEAHISWEQQLLPKSSFEEIVRGIGSYFEYREVPELDVIFDTMTQDKKNTEGKISFSLLSEIGSCHFDLEASKAQMEAAIRHYRSLK